MCFVVDHLNTHKSRLPRIRSKKNFVRLKVAETPRALISDVRRFAGISCGEKYSWYLDSKKTKIYCCGLNVNGSCGIAPEKIGVVERLVLVYDLENDVNAAFGEKVEEIVSGYSVNLVRTNHRLLFFGNNMNSQLPEGVFETWGFTFLAGFELKLDCIQTGKRLQDLVDLRADFDRISMTFNDKKGFVFNGGMRKLRGGPGIMDICEELEGFKVNKIAVGKDYELVYGEQFI